MTFDRKQFFDGYRAAFGRISQQQVRGLERLLTCIESDPFVKDLRWAAYMLATSKHETAETFHPIHEYGGRSYFIKRYGGHTRKGRELGNDTPEEGYHYAGKGDVQLTGESNYEKAEIAIRREYPNVVAEFEARTGKTFDLTVGDQPNDEADPLNVMDPLISYVVMSYGMRTGMFTSKKLSDYIRGPLRDYVGARKIINGTDRDVLIASYAVKFEKILRNSATVPDGNTAANVPPAESEPEKNGTPNDSDRAHSTESSPNTLETAGEVSPDK